MVEQYSNFSVPIVVLVYYYAIFFVGMSFGLCLMDRLVDVVDVVVGVAVVVVHHICLFFFYKILRKILNIGFTKYWFTCNAVKLVNP